jgi:putative transposase
MDGHIEHDDIPENRRNGKMTKTMRSDLGAFELSSPRDREGSWAPLLTSRQDLTI